MADDQLFELIDSVSVGPCVVKIDHGCDRGGLAVRTALKLPNVVKQLLRRGPCACTRGLELKHPQELVSRLGQLL
eukprot:CAMPEP_0196706468 /NCGR_PEP_ID=MMETSP1090-20130531/62037_1 /TAXON_ID=37098 /ORGANISM="Isochrysis sp, Strain CCMP1244" /LENGTH=74 /DNA_ID=CAMNT_0042046411 /DNA_START=422 /DNA_END=642 /DNA_ORIENTATION=+